MMPILVKTDGVRSGRKAKVRTGVKGLTELTDDICLAAYMSEVGPSQ